MEINNIEELILIVLALIGLILLCIMIWNKKKGVLSGKRLNAKYGKLIGKLAPFKKKIMYYTKDKSQCLELEIECMTMRNKISISYLYTFREKTLIQDTADFTGEEDEIEEIEDVKQYLAWLDLQEIKGKLFIKYIDGMEEEAFTWKFKEDTNQDKIFSLFMDTDVVDDGEPDDTELYLIKTTLEGNFKEIYNPFERQ